MWRSWADVKGWYRPSIGEMRLNPSISQKQSPACLSPSGRLTSHSFGIMNRWDYSWQCDIATCLEHHTCNDMHQSLHHADLSVIMCVSLSLRAPICHYVHSSVSMCTELSIPAPVCHYWDCLTLHVKVFPLHNCCDMGRHLSLDPSLI